MFIALNRKQRGEVMSIMRAVANASAALVIDGKAQELWNSYSEDSTMAEITVQDGVATARSLASPSKPRSDLYKIFFAAPAQESRSFFNKPTGMFHGEHDLPDSLQERLQSSKPLASRIVNGISGMIGSNPPSDDEGDIEGKQPKKARSLVKPSEVIIATWNNDAAIEFLGPKYDGRYAQAVNTDYLEDPEIAMENKRSSEKRHLDLDDCLNEFSKPEVLGDHDLWYCSKVSQL
jgi:ubiquitin carboxyl-terminal hydrolase 4/11